MRKDHGSEGRSWQWKMEEKKMSKYTKQDIIRIVEEEDVEFIRLQFTDMFGTLKNVAITPSQLEKALNNE